MIFEDWCQFKFLLPNKGLTFCVKKVYGWSVNKVLLVPLSKVYQEFLGLIFNEYHGEFQPGKPG